MAEQQIELQVKEKKISGLSNDTEKMKLKLEYLENQNRRNNLRIDGIPEDRYETWEQTEEKVKSILLNKLKLEEQPLIERAHRIGRRRNSDDSTSGQGSNVRLRPRTIVCKFYDWKLKEAILKSARRNKPEGIFINEDLAENTIKKRKDQLPRLKEAKQQGKIAYFVLDRLVIKDRS